MDFPLEMALTQFNRQDLKHAKKEEEKRLSTLKVGACIGPIITRLKERKLNEVKKVCKKFEIDSMFLLALFVFIICIYLLLLLLFLNYQKR